MTKGNVEIRGWLEMTGGEKVVHSLDSESFLLTIRVTESRSFINYTLGMGLVDWGPVSVNIKQRQTVETDPYTYSRIYRGFYIICTVQPPFVIMYGCPPSLFPNTMTQSLVDLPCLIPLNYNPLSPFLFCVEFLLIIIFDGIRYRTLIGTKCVYSYLYGF